MFDKLKGLGKKQDKTPDEKSKAAKGAAKGGAKGGGDKVKQQKQILGLIVLVAGGAAAYFYLNSGDMGMPSQVVPAQPAAKLAAKQKVTVPAEIVQEKRERDAKAAAEAQARASQTEPDQAESSPAPSTAATAAETSPAPASITQPNPPEAKPSSAPPVEKPQSPAVATSKGSSPAVVEPQTQPSTPVKPTTGSPAPAEVSSPEAQSERTVPSHSVATGPYYVNAGAYIVKANALKAQKAIKAAGFTPEIKTDKRKVKMTRLLVGTFDRTASEAKIRDLNRYSKGAFRMQKGSSWAVYAGSFYDLDQGRRYADLLYSNGIETEEEYTQIQMPLTIVTFGAFSTKEEARKAAKKIQRKGIEAAVAKR